MAQSEWRKARHLLITAGVMDKQGITAKNLTEALNQASAHYQRLVAYGAGATGGYRRYDTLRYPTPPSVCGWTQGGVALSLRQRFWLWLQTIPVVVIVCMEQ